MSDNTSSKSAATDQSGEASAFVGRQFREHCAALEGFVRSRVNDHDVARDIVNDVFLRMLRLRDPTRIEQNPRAYLFTIALNLITDWRRRGAVRARSAVQLEEAAKASRPQQPDEVLESEHTRQRLAAVFATLGERQRRAFIMSRIEDRSYAEIARELDVSLRTVERYISEVIARLRQELDLE